MAAFPSPAPEPLVRCAGPVFVIGAPRSGTTALGRAIGHHSHFYAGDETLFMTELFGNRRTELVHERWAGRPTSSWLRRENVSRNDVRAATDYARDNPHRCHVVLHRDLESDPATALAGVFSFLGVPDEPAPAEFLRTNRFNTSFPRPGRPGPMRPDEYRRPHPWTEWSDDQRAIFLEVAGPEMQAQGFPPTGAASSGGASGGSSENG